ncbi:MAG TPA: BlaI/MecI/CopY family transcriptional regulator [Verrucomicrobiae bacterium]|nr:BlaI/MecI/CopY family transcriptional regulator [Verrucomicrobiae bacterium]
MKTPPRISDAEWDVMRVVWARRRVSANDIIAELQKRGADWHPKTVKAFLNRLVKKHALGFELDGRAYVYHPLIEESACAEAASLSFLERVFGGSLKPMVAHFVARKRLSPKEIRELKDLLEGKE